MFLFVWVLFCTLAISNLQRVVRLKKPSSYAHKICWDFDLNYLFVNTTVVHGPSPPIKYCRDEDQYKANFTLLDAAAIPEYRFMKALKASNFTIFYDHVTPNSPIFESVALSINDHQELPLYVAAIIRHRHIRINPGGVLGRDTDERMALMGQLPTDEPTCLLPCSIGGARGINIVPMARNVSRIPGERFVSFNQPLSSWKGIEEWIIRFLQTYPAGRVEWGVVVQYADGVVTDPGRHRDYRPVGFARHITAFNNQSLWGPFYESFPTTLLNDNNDPCGKHFRDHILPLPSVCKDSTSPLGKEMSKNVWTTAHVVSIPYTIENRTFFYGQSITAGLLWFIQELLPDGKMGKTISSGRRAFYYKTVFQYSIDERFFLYSHRGSSGTYWFIQELLPDGKMGSKMTDGTWTYAHHVSFPYTNNGSVYFYGQIESTNKWYIRELLPDGLMGNMTSFGTNISPVVFVFDIESRVFLYSHDPVLLTWQMRELLPFGMRGPIIDQGNRTSAHHTAVPFEANHTLFFGQNLYSGEWFVQIVQKDGFLNRIVAQGHMDDRYEVVFSYDINGSHYLYTHSQMTKKWVIREE